MTEVMERINAAARFARNGERDQALRIFEQVVAQHPEESEAWLWISELANTLDEQITALDRAVECIDSSADPGPTLQERLNAIRGADSLPAPNQPASEDPTGKRNSREEPLSVPDTLLQWAERLVILGEDREAKRVLETLLAEDPKHVPALLLLSELTTSPEEQVRLVQSVLQINPTNADAMERAGTLRDRAALAQAVPMEPVRRQGLLRRAMSIFTH